MSDNGEKKMSLHRSSCCICCSDFKSGHERSRRLIPQAESTSLCSSSHAALFALCFVVAASYESAAVTSVGRSFVHCIISSIQVSSVALSAGGTGFAYFVPKSLLQAGCDIGK